MRTAPLSKVERSVRFPVCPAGRGLAPRRAFVFRQACTVGLSHMVSSLPGLLLHWA